MALSCLQRVSPYLILVAFNSLCTAFLLDSNMSEVLYELCPFNNFCQVEARIVLRSDKEIPCCRPCYCDDDCWRRGNCCPDKQDTPSETPIEVCEDTIVKRRKGMKNGRYDIDIFHGIDGEIKRYYVIKTCPGKESNKTNVMKCTGELQTSFEDYIWVTSLEDRKIYNNKFCAECHGIQNYTYWNLRTDCYELIDGTYAFSNDKTVPSGCRLFAVPPSEIDTSTSLCIIPTTSTCNITGEWQVYDRATEEACNAFESHFLDNSLFATDVYRNVFCYMCNKVTGITKENICHNLLTHSTSRTEGNSLSVLLDKTIYEKATDENVEERKCDQDEIHDPIQDTCRKLFCPVLSAPYYGSCIKISLQTKHLVTQVQYRLDPLWSQSTFTTHDPSMYKSRRVGNAIFQQFHKLLGLLGAHCQDCGQHVRVPKELQWDPVTDERRPAYFLVITAFITDKICQEDFIWNRMNATPGKNISVKIRGNGVMRFNVRLDKPPDDDVHLITTINILRNHDHAFCARGFVFFFSDTTMCPTVQLTINDYLLIMNKTSDSLQRAVIKSIFEPMINSLEGAHTRGNVSVCFDVYMSVVPNFGHVFVPIMPVFVFNFLAFLCITPTA